MTPPPQQLEILDLRHFNGRQLRPLLEQEAHVWSQRLRWDYRSSTELLLQYLDSRILPGFVALTRGKICGYAFCVYEGQKAVIGDIYAVAENPSPMAVNHTLARHLLETLQSSPEIDRIEAQLLLFDSGQLPPAFSGFRSFPRLFLEKDLTTHEPAPVSFPSGIEPLRWSAAVYNPVAELIQACYTGHIDSGINDQYCSLAGCLRFLHNIIRFPGCGAFDADSSWILRSPSDQIIGVLLCSRVAPDVAHVTQLCIAPEFRGQRLGKHLLTLALGHLRQRGYRALTLTVTEANTAAASLYADAGFRTRHRFDALVFDQPKPNRPRFTLFPA